MKHLSFLLCLATTLGCGAKDAAKEIRKGVVEGTKNIEDASKNIQEGAETLAKGLAAIDPAGIKQLLGDNESLKAQLEDLQATLNETFRLGRVSLKPNTRVSFEITKVVGDLTLDGWIGPPENPSTVFLNGFPVSDQGPLTISWKRGDRGAIEAACKHVGKKRCSWDDWEDLVQRGVWIGQMQADQFFKRAMPKSRADEWFVDLQLRLPSSGTYPVWLQVTPNRLEAGRWEIHYQIAAQDSEEPRKIIVGAMTNERIEASPDGAPEPVLLGEILVHVPVGAM